MGKEGQAEAGSARASIPQGRCPTGLAVLQGRPAAAAASVLDGGVGGGESVPWPRGPQGAQVGVCGKGGGVATPGWFEGTKGRWRLAASSLDNTTTTTRPVPQA